MLARYFKQARISGRRAVRRVLQACENHDAEELSGALVEIVRDARLSAGYARVYLILSGILPAPIEEESRMRLLKVLRKESEGEFAFGLLRGEGIPTVRRHRRKPPKSHSHSKEEKEQVAVRTLPLPLDYIQWVQSHKDGPKSQELAGDSLGSQLMRRNEDPL